MKMVNAGYAVVSPFEVIKVAPLPLATSTQQAELYDLSQACTLAKGKTANIYANIYTPFEWLMTLRCYGNSEAALLPVR